MRARVFLADHLCSRDGWRSPGVIDVDAAGMITRVRDALAPGESAQHLPGFVIPGLPNLHSHAFQRALAGFTEQADRGQPDSFWTWRERMYALAGAITPDDLAAIAAQLYVEMLEAGMTCAGEFHYVHHDTSGHRFAAPEEMSLAVLSAAAETGIALTHLPVLYLHGGFGKAPSPRQRRFVHDSVEDFFVLWDRLVSFVARSPLLRLGLAPHSLRAVAPAELAEMIDALSSRAPDARIHIHVAEQELEVEEAIAHLGARPVRWLADNTALDGRWCLVHATHTTPAEKLAIAASGAVAGLCPTTEANLGDGRFDAPDFVAAGGRFGVGSDSHISVSATEELRWLEYGQRLFERRRNLILGPAGGSTRVHTGAVLHREAALGGALALDQPAGAIEPGRRADLVVLDPEHPRLAGHGTDTALDAWIFGGADGAIREVWVGGERLVEGGRHRVHGPVRARFAEVMKRLG